MLEYLNYELFSNTVQDWIIAFSLFVVIWFFLFLFKYVILVKLEKFAKKTKTQLDDIAVEILQGFGWPFYAWISLYFSTLYLYTNSLFNIFMNYLLLVVLVYYAIKSLSIVITHIKEEIIKKQEADNVHDSALVDFLASLAKGLVWVFAILFVLSNLGVQITTFIAGLGIGGLAIAIALQGVLTDLFASITIYFDKPFRVGDFIVTGSDSGVVQKIGIKTTRIKTLQGQELVISNKELTETRVNNFKRMKQRRIVFEFGIVYETPAKKMRKIPKIVSEIFDKVDNADLDRVHFKAFNDFSLDYEVVYFVKSNDYAEYMDIQQNVNLDLKERFEKEKIDMAYPTQTLYVKK
ncbi:MAG: mechanosensitive ion channel family protein [Candidatus Woesearchaeota archaeon]